MYRLNFVAVVVFFALIVAGTPSWAADAGSQPQSSIEQTFQKAKKDYVEKNLNAAAEQIQKGAAYMKAESEKASANGKEALTESAKELEKLGNNVKQGTVKSVNRINESFARAYVALARAAHIKSTESWAKKETTKAGDALDSATENLERGFAWAGQKVERSTKEAMKKSKELALKLKKKGSVLAEEVGKELKKTGDEIEKFGKRIFPK